MSIPQGRPQGITCPHIAIYNGTLNKNNCIMLGFKFPLYQ